ncbi:NAD(P)-dependent alcohol dehydrogenase [Dehalococcoidia bacterium]|nr:NAD(P)-dependent alcohol dehydrogenase [Dehalococcoidia bacterium]
MKAYQIERDEGIDGLTLVERADPHPGEHEVVVGIHAVSLNFRDLNTIKFAGRRGINLPLIPCSDGAGEVLAVGGKVTRFQRGDRVAGIFFQNWITGPMKAQHGRSALGGEIDGMLAEKVTLHEDGLVPIPAHLSIEEASTLPCAAVTSWQALIALGSIKAGDTVLVQGTGGVSIFGLQFAVMSGARCIVTSSSDAKLARARELGSTGQINYVTHPDWDQVVLEMTGGIGANHIVEVGGAGTLAKSFRCASVGATVSLIGVLTGPGEVDPNPVLRKGITFQGIYVGSRDMFDDMNRAIEAHKMRPVVDKVFPFDQAKDALRLMESAAHFGKVVIKV